MDKKPVTLVRRPAFLAVWGAGATTNTARWLEMLVVAVYVFDRTGSPLMVASMIVLQMLPLALFGAIAGAMAERFSRRLMLLICMFMMVLTSGVLGIAFAMQTLALWHIGLGVFLSGVLWATEFPMRRTLLAEIAGIDQIGPAMSLDTVTGNGTRMLGPTLGGALLQYVGLGGAYWLLAILYGIGFALIFSVPEARRPAVREDPSIVKSLVEGFRYLRRDRTLVGILSVTLIFNLWGFPLVSMVPVIGKESLGLSPFPVGILAGAEGAGALLSALLIARYAKVGAYRRLYVMGLITYLLCAIGFSQSPQVWLAGLFLFLVGIGAAGFSTMQSTLVYLNSPAYARSRMMGLVMVCIGSGPIGFLYLGYLADHLGASFAVALLNLQGLVVLAILLWLRPELRSVQPATSAPSRD